MKDYVPDPRSSGRLLLQVRDNLPRVSDPGKISLFGGQREGKESFLECVVREIQEEIGLYLPPERLELILRYFGSDQLTSNRMLHRELFVARDVPADGLTITEGSLRIAAVNELEHIHDLLAAPRSMRSRFVWSSANGSS